MGLVAWGSFNFHLAKNNSADKNEEKEGKKQREDCMVASMLVASIIAWGVGQRMAIVKCHSHGLNSMSAMTKESAHSQS
jgi:hypothetical protein